MSPKFDYDLDQDRSWSLDQDLDCRGVVLWFERTYQSSSEYITANTRFISIESSVMWLGGPLKDYFIDVSKRI